MIWFYACCVIVSWTGWLFGVVADAVWLLCLGGFLDFVTS